jgi:xanthosine utilization system XapX-like protein
MAESWSNSGLAMMLVGGLMVAFAVATILLTNNPVPSAIAIIGLISVGVGARKRRTQRHL